MANQLSYAPWYDTLQQLKSEIFKGLRVCVPGAIMSINDNGTVDVSVGLTQNIAQPNTPKGLPASYPTLSMCPVLSMQGGGVGAVMPISIGDECLVVFSDRCIESWFSNGSTKPMPLPSLRMHDISDGFAIVGLNSLENVLLTPLGPNEGGICETKASGSVNIGAKIVVNSATRMIKISNGSLPANSLGGILDTMLTSMGAATTVADIATAAGIAKIALATLLY